ncbi:response regulator transcription factor [Aquisalinus flavus]|uniref:Transcriptional regulatory protein FixJ n=1 Tax=Aquisalinus flavus TaxID=1526572 RepID=A0A8J2Y813_9PROT|nr:response regulator [Aquisalinus flavus]MBD0426038.1 response regulator [Aquisalinus flavus]UNE48371.1 response regulator [Aquisalinus flavus]GGD11222.1 transcriptional regulatory protein FixJ [Aquisalinus flavus]
MDYPVSKPIYLVDDDPAVQRGVAALLVAAEYAVTVFDSGDALLACMDELDFQQAIVLADVCMPGIQGLELQARLVAERPGARVIVMTAHGDVPMAVRAMRGGAVDFLEKPFSAREVTTALDRAFAIVPAASPAPVTVSPVCAANYGRLTPREREVLGEMIEGNTSKLIARNLGLSPRTVEVHRQKIMQKMQARSFAELVRMAVDLDLSR